jgi:hypothetical protein
VGVWRGRGLHASLVSVSEMHKGDICLKFLANDRAKFIIIRRNSIAILCHRKVLASLEEYHEETIKNIVDTLYREV